VLEEVGQIVLSQSIRVISAGYVDGMDIDGAGCIPVDLAGLRKWYDDSEASDFGVVALQGLEADAILKNPKRQYLTHNAWSPPADIAMEGHYLIGYPKQWRSEVIADRERVFVRHMTVRAACVPIELIQRRTDSDPKGFWDHADCLYGNVLPLADAQDQPLQDICGASGGPLIGVHQTDDNKIRHYVVGVQSAWLPQSRILRAEPFEKVLRFLKHASAQRAGRKGRREVGGRKQVHPEFP
jgi:hypothetical protein